MKRVNGRYGSHFFEEVEPHKWACHFSIPYYWQTTLNEDGSIYAIDPDGGPYMRVGDKAPFCDEIIIEITDDPFIYTKPCVYV